LLGQGAGAFTWENIMSKRKPRQDGGDLSNLVRRNRGRLAVKYAEAVRECGGNTDVIVVLRDKSIKEWRAEGARYRQKGDVALADAYDRAAAAGEAYGPEGRGVQPGWIPRHRFSDPRAPRIPEFDHPAPAGKFWVLAIKGNEAEPVLLPIIADRPAEKDLPPEVARVLVPAAKKIRRAYAREARQEGTGDVAVIVHAKPKGAPEVVAATREIARAAAADAGYTEALRVLRDKAPEGTFWVLFDIGAEHGATRMWK
jgi:hypothetical protein